MLLGNTSQTNNDLSFHALEKLYLQKSINNKCWKDVEEREQLCIGDVGANLKSPNGKKCGHSQNIKTITIIDSEIP